MKKEKLKFSKGFTFLETIVAIFVVSVALVGGLGALTTILKSSHFSYNKLIASYLAQEGIEMVRNVRDTNWLENRYSPAATNWDEGLNGCSNGCQIDYRKFEFEDPVFQSFDNSKLKIDSNGFYQYDSGSDTMFSRKITITPQGDILIVKAEVFWKEGGKDHSVSFQSKLYKYNF